MRVSLPDQIHIGRLPVKVSRIPVEFDDCHESPLFVNWSISARRYAIDCLRYRDRVYLLSVVEHLNSSVFFHAV